MSTLPEAILDLKIGRVDVVISGQDTAAYYIEKTLNATDQFRVVDVGYGMGSAGIALRKDEPQVTADLQTVVNDIIKDGTASKISEKWLGIDKYLNWKF
jgi:polar amino acid transport system substrate-binding protein